MNAAFHTALEVDLEAARRAAAGFRTLDGMKIADVVEQACSVVVPAATRAGWSTFDLSDEDAERLESLEIKYDELVPLDSALIELFENYRAGTPRISPRSISQRL